MGIHASLGNISSSLFFFLPRSLVKSSNWTTYFSTGLKPSVKNGFYKNHLFLFNEVQFERVEGLRALRCFWREILNFQLDYLGSKWMDCLHNLSEVSSYQSALLSLWFSFSSRLVGKVGSFSWRVGGLFTIPSDLGPEKSNIFDDTLS